MVAPDSLDSLQQEFDEVKEVVVQIWEWDYYLIRKGRKWGVASLDFVSSGENPVIIPPMFDEIVAWNNIRGSYAIVKNEGKYGIAGDQGKIIVPIKYDEIDTKGFLLGHKWHVRAGNDWMFVQEDGEPWDGVEPSPYNPL